MTVEPIEILLVEDNVADLELTLWALRKNNLGNHIQVARDGEEALDFIFRRGLHANHSMERPLKLILLDLKLPKVNGLEVLREIKGNSRTKGTPVVILTSSREQKDLVNGFQLGVNSYIQKPVNFDEFREVIKQLGLYWILVNQPPPSISS